MATPSPAVREIERAIGAYLRAHPQALDTERGILEWWLRDASVRHSASDVRLAIAELVASGGLVQITLADGQVAYAIGPQTCGQS